MSDSEEERLYELLRDFEHSHASSYTSVIALDAFIESLKRLKAQDIYPQIQHLAHKVCESKPRIFPLHHIIKAFEHELAAMKPEEMGSARVKRAAIKILKRQRHSIIATIKRLGRIGTGYVRDGDFIILYSVSLAVIETILKARREGKSFSVLVLDQDTVKTQQLIKHLRTEEIAYDVVPSANLCQYIDRTTKLFLGALAVTQDNHVVSAAGSSNVVSMSHLHNVDVHLFTNSLQLSHRSREEQNIHSTSERCGLVTMEYSRTIHSHDIVDLQLFDRVIMEHGEIAKENLERYRCPY